MSLYQFQFCRSSRTSNMATGTRSWKKLRTIPGVLMASIYRWRINWRDRAKLTKALRGPGKNTFKSAVMSKRIRTSFFEEAADARVALLAALSAICLIIGFWIKSSVNSYYWPDEWKKVRPVNSIYKSSGYASGEIAYGFGKLIYRCKLV